MCHILESKAKIRGVAAWTVPQLCYSPGSFNLATYRTLNEKLILGSLTVTAAMCYSSVLKDFSWVWEIVSPEPKSVPRGIHHFETLFSLLGKQRQRNHKADVKIPLVRHCDHVMSNM